METLDPNWQLLGEEGENEHFRLNINQALLESDRETEVPSRTPGPPLVTNLVGREHLPMNVKRISLAEMQRIDPSYRKREPPRNLKSDEIEELLAQVPPIQSIVKEVSEMVTGQLLALYRRRMHEPNFMLSKSQEGVARYIDRQNKLTESSRSETGDMMGMKGVFSESSAVTQATMKVKKKVNLGGAGLKGGINNMKSLLHAQETPQEMNMSIHFREKVTRRQVIDLNAQLAGVTVGQLMDRENIRISKISRGNYKASKTDDTPIGPSRREVDNLSYNIAHDIYTASGTSKRSLNYENNFLRIALNRDKLYMHRLTPYKIAALLRSHEEIDRSVRIIPSSFADAFLDVFTTSDTKSVDQQIVDLYYIALEKIRSVTAQGIPKIERIDHKIVEYHQFFKVVRQPFPGELKFEFKQKIVILEYDLMTMANHNYPDTKFIEDSLIKAGIKIIERLYMPHTGRLYAYVISPIRTKVGPVGLRAKVVAINEKYGELFSFLTPDRLTYLKKRGYEGDKIEQALIAGGIVIKEAILDDGKVAGYLLADMWNNNLRDALMELDSIDREYVYAISEGSDMAEICTYSWVDTSRLTTNSVPIMARYFGIEAARNYFIYDYIANKVAVDALAQPRFTFIVADDMTFWGRPYGITFHENTKKKDNDYISLSTIGHPNQIYATYASRNGVSLMSTNAASMTATGEIFAGSNTLGVIGPTPEDIVRKLKATRTKKIITHRGLLSATRQRTERIMSEQAERFVDPVLTRRVIIPNILPTPDVTPLPLIRETLPGKQARLASSYVRSPITESLIDGLTVPARNIDSARQELISGFMVTQQECLDLLEIENKMQNPVDLFSIILRHSGGQQPARNKRQFEDYLAVQIAEDEEEDIENFIDPFQRTFRFVPKANNIVEMVI